MTVLPRLARQKDAPRVGIVHLGLGAFFRSHGAIMVEEAIEAVGGDWGIVGVCLKTPGTRDRLAPQDNIYTAVEMTRNGQKTRTVSVLSEVIFAPEETETLLARLTDPNVKIVSLTVTEKGYCHVPSTGKLELQHSEIQHDIKYPTPKSAVGCLVSALKKRRENGDRPFTVLSCDNLPSNGHVTRNVVVGLAEAIDPDLAKWIAKEVRFPCTMVDRIVPATTQRDIDLLSSRTGYLDEAPVFHEPFRQWAIEDDFVDGQRPGFEDLAGVQLVEDVAPFELMKVRMLNGTHSALAYLGYLAGKETIAETVEDQVFSTFAQLLWDREIIPTLNPPTGVDLHQYAQDLLERYSNPAIQHRNWQIAMDGSQKLPQRILGTIADNQSAGRPCHGLILAVAAWMRYVGGSDEHGQSIDVRDPLASRLRDLTASASNNSARINRLLSVKEVFEPDLVELIEADILAAYESLLDKGAQKSVEDLIGW